MSTVDTVDNTGNSPPPPPPLLTVMLTTRKLHITINFLQIKRKTLPKTIKLLSPFIKKACGSLNVTKYLVKVIPADLW